MKIYLIRHGKTKGNTEYRYVGRTDEPVLETEAERLGSCAWRKKLAEEPEQLYVSPMLRCIQTAEIYFPGHSREIVADLRECDFGTFEYHNYQELSGEPAYQAYIDSNGETAFPEGESKQCFSLRCVNAFRSVLERPELKGCSSCAFVVHGGTIMAVLEAFSSPKKSYFDWPAKNGCGYEADWDEAEKKLINIRYLDTQPETEG